MKKLLLTLVGFVFVGSMAMAADAENTETTKVDHSKNPITGTKTTKKKFKKKVKDEEGHSADMNVTETTKEKKDGSVKTSTDVDAEAASKK